MKKWTAKAENKGYNKSDDFVDTKNGEPPKKRKKTKEWLLN